MEVEEGGDASDVPNNSKEAAECKTEGTQGSAAKRVAMVALSGAKTKEEELTAKESGEECDKEEEEEEEEERGGSKGEPQLGKGQV